MELGGAADPHLAAPFQGAESSASRFVLKTLRLAHWRRRDRDALRTAYLATKGISVVRYHAVDVLFNAEGVVQHLWHIVKSRQPSAAPVR